MTPTRPYLLRAFYEWIVDNNCTPHIVVNAELPDVMVPEQYIENGQIVLNIAMSAVHNLEMGNESINFSARFAGIAHNVYIPLGAILAVYAKENGRGMIFAEEDEQTFPPTDKDEESSNSKGDKGTGSPAGKKTKGKPNLTIVK